MDQPTIEAIIAGIFAILAGLMLAALLKSDDWPLVPVLVGLGIAALIVGIVTGILLTRQN